MIAVLGLLLTTGGYNAQQMLDSSSMVQTPQVVVQGQVHSSNVEKGQIDVQLHTQAHLQVPPTPEAKEGSRGASNGDGSRTGVLPDVRPSVTPSTSIEGIICAYPWPQGCDYWIGVARCESTLGQDPNAYADWNPYVGLFQIWVGHNYGREWLKDDANNTLAAWELSHEGTRTSPWPWCQRQ